MNRIVGAIFPVTLVNSKRIFEEKKIVFIKFTKMNFSKNSKILFYITNEKYVCGEATIESVRKMSSSEAWDKHEKDLFLNQKEYEDYTQRSPIDKRPRVTKEVTVFILKNARKYEICKTVKKMTPSGCYISEEEYDKLTR
jgi:hypothetical protein